MIFGIISDIHGNLPALEAVSAWFDKQPVDRIFCTGDIVGYGPWPGECLDAVTALTGAVGITRISG